MRIEENISEICGLYDLCIKIFLFTELFEADHIYMFKRHEGTYTNKGNMPSILYIPLPSLLKSTMMNIHKWYLTCGLAYSKEVRKKNLRGLYCFVCVWVVCLHVCPWNSSVQHPWSLEEQIGSTVTGVTNCS